MTPNGPSATGAQASTMAKSGAATSSSIIVAERSSIQRGEIHGTVPGEWIRPYVHQRYDDLSPLGSD